MRLLLDTHALLWYLENSERLSRAAREAIGDPASQRHVSDATAWEIGIKISLGKLRLPVAFHELFPSRIEKFGFRILPIRHRHLHRVITLPLEHRDPFDRMLIAQAISEDLTLVSCDRIFTKYGVRVLW